MLEQKVLALRVQFCRLNYLVIALELTRWEAGQICSDGESAWLTASMLITPHGTILFPVPHSIRLCVLHKSLLLKRKVVSGVTLLVSNFTLR
jgi:hypothetical protein